MILGNGDIAQILIEGRVDQPNKLFFASGVSNSRVLPESEYEREKDLLMQQPKDLRLVYFGSLSVFFSETRYSQHKLEMENLIKKNFPMYVILRIGNITWGRNPNILINYMKDCVKFGKPYVKPKGHQYRYVIEKDELLHWIKLIPNWSCEINIPGQRLSFEEIFRKYVSADYPI